MTDFSRALNRTRASFQAMAALGLAAFLIPAGVLAAGNPALGQQKAATCVACHGEDGKGISPEFPTLAGQYASYLEQALKQYKNGQRKNAIMAGFAAGLSEKDMQDLAAYYSAMESGLTTLRQ